MKPLLNSVIVALICQAALCDFASHMEDEFKSVEAMDAKAAGKEHAKKDSTIEAQLNDLLDSVNKEKDSKEKRDAEDKDLFAIFKAFESSDTADNSVTADNSITADKDDLLNTMEDIIKKEVLASKKDVFSSDAAEDTQGSCIDNRRDCLALARRGYCGTHENEMRRKCAKTCQFCVKCVNAFGDKVCKQYKQYGYCKKHQKSMNKLCFKECNYCSKPPPVNKKCASSKYGCCWDKIVVKLDKEGSNCPPCEDRKKTVCTRFRFFCNKENKAGEYVRRNCPDKCGICGMKCSDDISFKDRCATWKQLGWCSSVKGTMKILCQATCNFC